ncbi:MAG: flagellar biosynthesis protein FlhB [Buchnera aphidicola (Eriosoma harunire)]
MNHDSHEDKTEQPTHHRLKKARKEGIGTKHSRELHSIIILLVALINFSLYKSVILSEFRHMMVFCLDFNLNILNNFYISIYTLLNMLKKIFFLFTYMICSITFVIFLIPWLLNDRKLSFSHFKLKFDMLNPINGITKILSFQVIVELCKTILKIFLVMSVCLFYLWLVLSKILSLLFINDIVYKLHFSFNILFMCCVLAIVSMSPIVLFDVFFQYFKYYKNLKMSRQEIRDEFKQMEGDPLIKSRIRQSMKEMLKKRMIVDIQHAHVIIKNPIHYAIALQYNEKKMNAPKVLAKGAGELALKICKLGEKHCIPIISAPALAHTLYRYTDIGQYIPSKLYTAVAEVLAWVWHLEKWKKEGGVSPITPNKFSIPDEMNVIGENQEHV